jgi:hypothetical protein
MMSYRPCSFGKCLDTSKMWSTRKTRRTCTLYSVQPHAAVRGGMEKQGGGRRRHVLRRFCATGPVSSPFQGTQNVRAKSSHRRSPTPVLAQQEAARTVAIGVSTTPGGGQTPERSRSTAHIRKIIRLAGATYTAPVGPSHPYQPQPCLFSMKR